MRAKRLLSVDFDYFFMEKSQDPEEWMYYDWGHRDGGSLFLETLWYHRAAYFLSNNKPLPGLTDLINTFWSRFKFAHGCKLFYAESHSAIYNLKLRRSTTEVYSYDAHHDSGYHGETETEEGRSQELYKYISNAKVTCEDWVVAYSLDKIKVKVIYPQWKSWAIESEPKPLIEPTDRSFDDELPVKKIFHNIFVCRSGGWVPSWLDEHFDKFIESCPVEVKVNLDGITNRNFDYAVLNKEVQQLKEIRK